MPRSTVHLVCNAHLDPVWQWEWEEGAAEAVSTFRVAADLCEEFDGFVFNHNEVNVYRWVEEYEPALFERIRRLVREGRWHIMGGWYLQPDCNMPSGESLVRQALLGRRYFAEKFGVRPTTAANLDPFGHGRGLPQILRKSGYDSYLICRPGQEDCPIPADTFTWVGDDGSEVTVCRTGGYNSSLGGARGKVEHWMRGNEGRAVGLVLWGVGNHGGGPSRQDLRDLAALIAESEAEIAHSTPEAYFAAVHSAGDLPRVDGALNPWAVGCYSSQVRLKQRHRELENALYSLEKMCAAAWLNGRMEYPASEIGAVQRDLAESEFHDILPGSSVQPVEETSLRLLDHGLEIASRLRARAFFALAAGQPKAAEGEIPILVYNPHPFPVRRIVECEFMLADQNWTDTYTHPTVFHEGVPLASQCEKEQSNLPLDWRKRVAFEADLAPSAMSRFDCRLERLERRSPMPTIEGDRYVFVGEDLEVEIGAATGLLEACRVRGVEALGPGACRPIVLADDEDPWGMRVRGFREVVGAFTLMPPERGTRFSGLHGAPIPSVRVVEDGSVRTVVEAVLEFGDSQLCQRYKLPKRGTRIEVETRVHWAEKDRMLKLALPLPDAPSRLLGQAAYAVDDLPTNGDEGVAQKWVAAVSPDGSRALTCTNAGAYAVSLAGSELRLTLLRSPAYCGHPICERHIVRQDRYSPRIDQGERLFAFSLDAGAAAERLAAVDREALVENERPFALSFFPSGSGDPPEPLATLSDAVVQMACVKRAEDGDDLIVRLFEPTGTGRTTTLTLPVLGLSTELTLAPFEIRTLRVSPATGTFQEADLMEEALP